MFKTPLRIVIAALLCAAALIGLVVRESMARAAGHEVQIAMEAIDPRALLSGHYVIINLREQIETPCPAYPQGAEWIALAPEGARHRLAGAANTREAAHALGPVAARGSFICNSPGAANENAPAFPGWIALDLGIDRFYIDQAEAQRIERVLREQRPGEGARVFAIVSIGRDGRARLIGLNVEGERLELGWL